MNSYEITKRWQIAIACFVVVMIFFDTHYIMPKYLPSEGAEHKYMKIFYASETALVYRYILSFLKFVFGIPLIFLHLNSYNLAFGAGLWGTAASSSLVYYTLLLPYIAVLWFFIPGKTGVPPAYRVFQALITMSGAKYIKRSLGNRGETFNQTAFEHTNKKYRVDKYQAIMEAEELEEAADMALQEAYRLEKISAAYETHLIVKTDAEIQSIGGMIDLTRKQAQEAVTDAKHQLKTAKYAPVPTKPSKKSVKAKTLYNDNSSRKLADAERIKSQTDVLKSVVELQKMRARKNAWEKKD